MDCSLAGPSVHEILRSRILEGIAISLSRGSSLLKHKTQISGIAGRDFTFWATRKKTLLDVS